MEIITHAFTYSYFTWLFRKRDACGNLTESLQQVIESVRHSPRSPGIWYGSPETLQACCAVFGLDVTKK